MEEGMERYWHYPGCSFFFLPLVHFAPLTLTPGYTPNLIPNMRKGCREDGLKGPPLGQTSISPQRCGFPRPALFLFGASDRLSPRDVTSGYLKPRSPPAPQSLRVGTRLGSYLGLRLSGWWRGQRGRQKVKSNTGRAETCPLNRIWETGTVGIWGKGSPG